MSLKAMDLFEAYQQNKLPMDEGYIVSSFFKTTSSYSIYEIVSYSAVKDFYASGNSITLQTNGKKIYVLVEPSNFIQKTVEPYCRAQEFQIPLRFSEANIITAKNQARIIFNKEPQQAISAFTVLRPEGMNFAFLFYSRPDVFKSMELFFSKTLNQEAGIPQADAAKASAEIAEICAQTLTWPKDRE
ncbi:hypothetical protein K7J14_02820 [Treponema zuelzerae]|uniref:Uncharacterized protein n=1 Tax=Teretinema zuelzerae TaxID=156 RepID=A0AAE3EF62_9SPIR|nr:hypothetical protein [Teretinema zuelzerae]MCD1653630.1 hypothetical protein [Teretinema zuelzerae]HPO03056.1 hypothetical protein [Treponemataceae bacterium]